MPLFGFLISGGACGALFKPHLSPRAEPLWLVLNSWLEFFCADAVFSIKKRSDGWRIAAAQQGVDFGKPASLEATHDLAPTRTITWPHDRVREFLLSSEERKFIQGSETSRHLDRIQRIANGGSLGFCRLLRSAFRASRRRTSSHAPI